MRKIKSLLFVCILVLLAANLSSCDWVKEYFKENILGLTEDVKPEGYIESKENDLFKYDVCRDGIVITEYKGEDTTVIIPEYIDGRPVISIWSLAFYNNNIIEYVTLPRTLQRIEASGFYYSNKLKEIVIPDSVTYIGDRAFAWCTAMTSVTLPSGLTEIPNYAFNECSSLTKIIIPPKVTSIGVRAFSWCTSLTRVEIPDSVRSIGENAFMNCSSLEYVIVPDSTTEFGQTIFKNCPQLTVVVTSEYSPCALYCKQDENNYPYTTVRPPEETSEDAASDVSAVTSKK
ncbi:MAG TPA: leucine-rich repeat domain-containing protein [Bacillota bacterium]|nr:leucine-rich repeat domain-containing protein [Bacillota bacterium]HOK69374.1 leucine-rich repeat domain-containing protein [Bacillota bacterium]HPP86107.1 leucine-rich repeat domain-containing protein [Bacillota bacterium]